MCLLEFDMNVNPKKKNCSCTSLNVLFVVCWLHSFAWRCSFYLSRSTCRNSTRQSATCEYLTCVCCLAFANSIATQFFNFILWFSASPVCGAYTHTSIRCGVACVVFSLLLYSMLFLFVVVFLVLHIAQCSHQTRRDSTQFIACAQIE